MELSGRYQTNTVVTLLFCWIYRASPRLSIFLKLRNEYEYLLSCISEDNGRYIFRNLCVLLSTYEAIGVNVAVSVASPINGKRRVMTGDKSTSKIFVDSHLARVFSKSGCKINATSPISADRFIVFS